MELPSILSVTTIAFTVLDYPMSYIELVGTVFYLWSVWLISKRHILNWPIGIVSVILYMFLFYQIQLYSDTIEQVYFLLASIYGWWYWNKSPQDQGKISDVFFSNSRTVILWAVFTAVISIISGSLMSRIHLLLPSVFHEPASYPYMDALTTIMSFSAMWLMAKKKVESWIYWIIVDVIGIWLYYNKNVKLISLLYIILAGMAINGLRMWWKQIRKIESSLN